MTQKQKNEKFEESLGRLEEILRVMEKGDLGLEEAIQNFREGSRLYESCRKKLKTAEGEIKILMENLDGEIEEEPFEGTP